MVYDEKNFLNDLDEHYFRNHRSVYSLIAIGVLMSAIPDSLEGSLDPPLLGITLSFVVVMAILAAVNNRHVHVVGQIVIWLGLITQVTGWSALPGSP